MPAEFEKESMEAMDAAHRGQEHERTLTRHYLDPMCPAEFDCFVTDRPLASASIHPDSFYASFGTIAHDGIRNRGRGKQKRPVWGGMNVLHPGKAGSSHDLCHMGINGQHFTTAARKFFE